MTALPDAVKTVAGRDHPGIGRWPLQIFAEIFEHRGRFGGNRGEVVERFINAGRQAGSCNVVAQDSAIHDLGKEAGLRDQVAHQVRDIFLPFQHERFLIASSATEGDHHYLSLASRRRSPCPGRAKKSAPQSHTRGIAKEIASSTSNNLADFACAGEISHFDSIRLTASQMYGSPPSTQIGVLPLSAYQYLSYVAHVDLGIAPL